MRPPFCTTLAIVGTALALPDASAQWNQFRGANGSGIAGDGHPPVAPDASHLAWESDVPPGLSSPVVAGDAVVLTGLDAGRLVTLALDKRSGVLLWKREAPDVPLAKVHETSSPAASTAAADDLRIIVYFGSYGVLAYDHEGAEQWRLELPVPKSLYGASTSPILDRGRVYVILDDDRDLAGSKLSRSRLLALDAATGDVVWETPRPFNRSGWSTPTIWRHGEGEEIVVLGSSRGAGYDLASGEELWFTGGFSRETIARPVVGDGRVYLSAAMLGGVPDEQPDPEPFWAAVMRFDADGDERLQRSEMTGHFTFPLRPELPLGHPGFGIPLPSDPGRRTARLDGMMGWIDKDKDGSWTRDEFVDGISFSRGKPKLVAIRPGARGEVQGEHLAWELNRSVPEIPSPIFFGGRIYMIGNGGLLTAVDAGDGAVLYRERLAARGHYSASPVVAAGHLYLISALGELTVIRCGDTFEPVHQFDLAAPVAVTPAIDGEVIFVRTEASLRAYRGSGG